MEKTEGLIPAEPAAAKGPFHFEKLRWPSAEAALQNLKARKSRTLIHGVPGSSKSFLLAWFYRALEEKKPWLIVTPTREEALILQDDLSTWLPDVPVQLCPSWETLPRTWKHPIRN